MVRDAELEHKILIELERKGYALAVPGSPAIEGYKDNQIRSHVGLLVNRGLIVEERNPSGHVQRFTLSAEGYAFLEALRNNKPAAKFKANVMEMLKLLAAAIVGGIVTKLIDFWQWP